MAAPADASTDVARTAGRGGLAIAFAKVYFIVIGLAQQILLKHVLGLDRFGALSSALSIASITYNPIVSTAIQGVSRVVAQAPDAEQAAAQRKVLVIHAALALVLALGFFGLSGFVGRLIGAPHIVPALRVLSAVLLFYGLYTPLVGVLNGQKKFLHQAGLDMLAATLRTVGLVVGGWWFLKQYGAGIEGSSIGFVSASAVVFCVALALVGIGRAGQGGPTFGEHMAFITPLLLGQVLLNLLLQADITLLRAFASDSALAAGLGPVAADPLVGAYRATQLFCFLPYQLLIAVMFILFPMLATAWRDGDRQAVARYVQTGVRIALVLAGLMVSVTSGLSGQLLRLVFGADAAALATEPMQLLTIGFGAFAILGVLTTVLNSLKQERASAAIIATAVALVALLCWWRVRGAPFGPDLLWRTAIATSAGLAVATLGAALLVKRTAGSVVPPLTLVRVLIALAVSIIVGRFLPVQGAVLTLAGSAFVAFVYVLLLIAMREIGRSDVESVKAVLARRARRG